MERRNFLRGKSDSGFHYDEQENITTLCCSRSVKQAILRRRNYLCTINEDKARTFSGVLDEVKLSKGAVSKGRKRERESGCGCICIWKRWRECNGDAEEIWQRARPSLSRPLTRNFGFGNGFGTVAILSPNGIYAASSWVKIVTKGLTITVGSNYFYNFLHRATLCDIYDILSRLMSRSLHNVLATNSHF